MGTDEQAIREERAARNHAMFRAVSKEMRGLDKGFASITDERATSASARMDRARRSC